MKTKLLPVALIALTASAVLAAPGVASAKPAKVAVTIHYNGDGFEGTVSSKKPGKCANNREVVVYKQLGGSPHPGNDDALLSDTSGKSGNRFEWSTGTSGQADPGKYYARVAGKGGCRVGISKTINVS
ncbi:MAG: hypothetical protein EXQ70_08365 [Solirubrobacterales bacterium]|nr:hypothetical protein [Solirubrobacterales bacterium]